MPPAHLIPANRPDLITGSAAEHAARQSAIVSPETATAPKTKAATRKAAPKTAVTPPVHDRGQHITTTGNGHDEYFNNS